MNLPTISNIRKTAITGLFLFSMLFVMVTPVLANTSSWSFFLPDLAWVVNGKKNQVFHTMTAGNLTFSSSFYVSRVIPTAGNPSALKFTVYKNGIVSTRICSTANITPSKMVGSAYAKSFSIGCGNIAAGKYWIFIEKIIGAGDGYEIVGSGTLRTP